MLKHDFKFTSDKTFINDCCLRYRPDFLFDCGSYYLIVECDEDAHNQYDKECEIIRMNNISSGLGLPTKFIRYNPDNKEFNKKHKENVLVNTIKENIDKEFIEDLLPIYLFY